MHQRRKHNYSEMSLNKLFYTYNTSVMYPYESDEFLFSKNYAIGPGFTEQVLHMQVIECKVREAINMNQ